MLIAILSAHAAPPPAPAIDPSCVDVAADGLPDNYDEQAQVDFLANRFALAGTLSPLHGPIPHAAGRGAIGVELAGIPPVSCSRRLVENYAKTQDANKLPVLPRIRATYAFPALGKLLPYAGVAYLPPVPFDDDTHVVLSGELGFGVSFGKVQAGARFHASLRKTVGALAPPDLGAGEPIDDLLLGSTLGGDLSFGYALEMLTPYLAVGVTDASTYYYVGEDNLVLNNLHPYAGPTVSLGVDGLWKRLRFGGELYAAPGGFSLPDPNVISPEPAARYGHLYTARIRVGYEL